MVFLCIRGLKFFAYCTCNTISIKNTQVLGFYFGCEGPRDQYVSLVYTKYKARSQRGRLMAGRMKEGDLLTPSVYWFVLYKCEAGRVQTVNVIEWQRTCLGEPREMTHNGALH